MAHQFSDELIGQIRDLLQVALLSGTDIIDHLRMIYVDVGEDGKLALTNEYKEVFNSQLESMIQQVEEWKEMTESSTPTSQDIGEA